MKAQQDVCGRDVHQCKHGGKNELDRKFICQKMVNCMSKMYSPIRDRNVKSTDISKPVSTDFCAAIWTQICCIISNWSHYRSLSLANHTARRFQGRNDPH